MALDIRDCIYSQFKTYFLSLLSSLKNKKVTKVFFITFPAAQQQSGLVKCTAGT